MSVDARVAAEIQGVEPIASYARPRIAGGLALFDDHEALPGEVGDPWSIRFRNGPQFGVCFNCRSGFAGRKEHERDDRRGLQ